ncbi:hypothetical protein REPUB_Repub14bG0096500 [Reevesia pubescens]
MKRCLRIRDVGGNILAMFFGRLDCCDANVAEVIAIKTALKVFLEANLLFKDALDVMGVVLSDLCISVQNW